MNFILKVQNYVLLLKKNIYYRQVFNTNFNLHFHVTRKDTCKICDKYKQAVNIENDAQQKAKLEIEHNIHLANAEKARSALKAVQN